MKKHHIAIIIILGIFLIPCSAFACAQKIIKTEKSCCQRELTAKTDKKSCCDNSDNSKKECGGKCGNSSCAAASVIQLSVITTFEIDFKNNDLNFSLEKHKFFHSVTFLSSGFNSLWLIPKIS